ncbi:MAG: hypothetical protein U0793_03385 [Gemmataceae bacterium]
METVHLVALGIGVPTDFPLKAYERVQQTVPHSVKDVYRHFAHAWMAVAYRFRECAEHDEAFTALVRAEPCDHEQHYQQAKELFGFFTSGGALVESYCYALFAIGSMLRPAVFDMTTAGKRRDIKPTPTLAGLRHAYPGHLPDVLDKVLKSGEFNEWQAIRNTLLHRLSPSFNIAIHLPFLLRTPERDYNVGKGGVKQTWGKIDVNGVEDEIEILDTTTRRRRTWLAAVLGELLDATVLFLDANWPK